jgi:putative flippase GtrA
MMSGGALAVPGGVAPAGGRRGVALPRHPLLVQVARYAVVGGLGTVVNAAIFLVLRTWWDLVPATLLALVLSTAVSTEANRRFTFGGAMAHRWRAHVQVGGTVLFYAGYSSTVLLVLHTLVDGPSPIQETVAIAAASVLGGTCRFLLLRHWVFEPDDPDEEALHGVRPADSAGAWHGARHESDDSAAGDRGDGGGCGAAPQLGGSVRSGR